MILHHCFILHEECGHTELNVFRSEEALWAGVEEAANLMKLQESFDDIRTHLVQAGCHHEGDTGISLPSVTAQPRHLLAVTDPACADIEKPCKELGANLGTLIEAATLGDLCLMECRLNTTGELVAAICARQSEAGVVTFTPFGVMLNGNPYEMLTPPTQKDSNHE